HGTVPCTRPLTEAEINGEYEARTGDVIVEAFEKGRVDPLRIPAVLVSCHGPFAWGGDALKAADNAAYLEMVAKLALDTLALKPDCSSVDKCLLDKHFLRKHGPNAYYGQKND
ncbi:MAG: class II aldolase/adducin family protein, partial [Lentisphaeria bacterium]|nr:class II aldolase/adducin family protein [Lentisphaeria bacterium]